MRQLKITKSITNRESQSLEKYLQEIGKVDLLTPEEEVELAKRIKQGDQAALEKLTKANLRFVVSVAKQYQNQGLSLSDLINEGNLGLIKAAQRFDETRGFKFISYAVWWIRQSMTRGIACQSRTIRLPVHLGERLSAVRRVSLELAHKLGAMPSRQEIAEAMAIPIEELDGLLRQSLTTSSLDAPVNGEESRSALGDLIACPASQEPLELMQRTMDHDQLQEWLSQLSAQERQVLDLRFGINGAERSTLAQIGRLMDVSRERVRQVELRALQKLRSLSELCSAAP